MSNELIYTDERLHYFYRNHYSSYFKSLLKVGINELSFTDVNITELVSGNTQKDRGTLAFYKERWLEVPSHICFTIYHVESNTIIVELHVELSKKRLYWKRPETRFIQPNFKLTLTITQDPSVRVWVGTSMV